MMNNKGFTLIEALSVIVLVSIVLAVGGYAVSVNLKDSKEKSLDILKSNIKNGAINYYNECKYLSGSNSMCNGKYEKNENKLIITVNNLKEYGFLEGIMEEDNTGASIGNLVIVNPVSGEDIRDCEIKLIYNSENKNFTFETTSIGLEECRFINN